MVTKTHKLINKNVVDLDLYLRSSRVNRTNSFKSNKRFIHSKRSHIPARMGDHSKNSQISNRHTIVVLNTDNFDYKDSKILHENSIQRAETTPNINILKPNEENSYLSPTRSNILKYGKGYLKTFNSSMNEFNNSEYDEQSKPRMFREKDFKSVVKQFTKSKQDPLNPESESNDKVSMIDSRSEGKPLIIILN